MVRNLYANQTKTRTADAEKHTASSQKNALNMRKTYVNHARNTYKAHVEQHTASSRKGVVNNTKNDTRTIR